MAHYIARIQLVDTPPKEEASQKLYADLKTALAGIGYRHDATRGVYFNEKESDTLTIEAVAGKLRMKVSSIWKKSKGEVTRGETSRWSLP